MLELPLRERGIEMQMTFKDFSRERENEMRTFEDFSRGMGGERWQMREGERCRLLQGNLREI